MSRPTKPRTSTAAERKARLARMPPPGAFAAAVLMDGAPVDAPTPADLDPGYVIQQASRFAGLVLGQRALTVQVGTDGKVPTADLVIAEVPPLPTLASTIEAAACRLMRQASARSLLGPVLWRELVEARRDGGRGVVMGRTVAEVAVSAPLPPVSEEIDPETRSDMREHRADAARSLVLSAGTIAGVAAVSRTYPGWGPILSGRLMPPSDGEIEEVSRCPVIVQAAWVAGLLASGRPSPQHPMLDAIAERPEVQQAVAALRASGHARTSASRAARAAMEALAPLLAPPPSGSSSRRASSPDGAGSMPPASSASGGTRVERVGEASMMPSTAGEGVRFAIVREARMPGHGGGRVELMREQARPLLRLLRSRITVERPRPQEPGHSSGLLDPPALHRLPSGNHRVFIRTPERGRDRIAVGLLIDGSGSMYRRGIAGVAPWGSSRSHAALAAGYALGQVLAAHPRVTLRAWRHTATLPSRGVSSVVLTSLRPTEAEDWAAAAMLPHRENADGEAVQAAASDLRQVPAARRILVCISDGCPHVGQTEYIRAAGRAATAAAIRRARRDGVEIVGLAISPEDELPDSAMAEMYGPRWLRIDPSQIGGTVATRLGRILEGDL